MKEKIKKLKQILVQLSLIIFGLGGFISTYLFKYDKDVSHLVRDLSVTLSSIGLVSIIYEFYLRKEFEDSLNEKIKNLLEQQTFLEENILDLKIKNQNSEIEKIVNDQIKKHSPKNIARLNNCGVFDVFDELKVDRLSAKFLLLKNEEIRISKMWIPSPEVLEDVFYNAIVKNNCTIKIVLLDPELGFSTLEKRSCTIEHYNPERLKDRIKENINSIISIRAKLKEIGKEDSLKFHTHDSFVSVSLVGYSDNWIMGTYLNKRIATKGTQIKIKGKHTPIYLELESHFNHLFDIVSKEYVFPV